MAHRHVGAKATSGWRHFQSGTGRIAIAALALLILAPAAIAQRLPPEDCLQSGEPLIRMPELISENGKLRGTIILGDQERRLQDGTGDCALQFLRYFKGVDAVAPPMLAGIEQLTATPAANKHPDPVPGPTLRARVGDIVELTFLNQVDPLNYPNSLDVGADAGACDQFSSGTGPGYPQSASDTYPNCFHGSSTANIHFHGTHTNPNSTGDNIFLNVRPSPREDETPIVTAKSVENAFEAFFAECEQNLQGDVLSEWPHTWSEATSLAGWTQEQKTLLQAYDAGLPPYTPPAKPIDQQLWPQNQKQLDAGRWPQYYVGAYPFCYRLPAYTETEWPPEGPLKMGQAPGLHWYHAHKHGSTALNVSNGMTGAFVIEGPYDDALNAFYGSASEPNWTRAQPVLVINQLAGQPNLARGAPLGPAPLSVNGRLQPTLTMRPGEVQLWRIVNTSSRTFVKFLPPTEGFEWKQLAQDGVQFADVNYQRSTNQAVLLAPGNRADLLVKAPVAAPGTRHAVMVSETVSMTAPDSPVPLMSVLISGDAPAEPNRTEFIKLAPRFPPFLVDITDKDVKGTKTITFDTNSAGAPMHTIDGVQFGEHIGAAVLLSSVEEWKIANSTIGLNIDHPFHIHINPFQIVEVFAPTEMFVDPATGANLPRYVFDPAAKKSDLQCLLDPHGDPADWKPCVEGPTTDRIWWDVFPIPAGVNPKNASGANIVDSAGKPIVVPGYFKMRSRFVDYPGQYVLHCHILAHEDRGMMTIVEVVPNALKLQHH